MLCRLTAFYFKIKIRKKLKLTKINRPRKSEALTRSDEPSLSRVRLIETRTIFVAGQASTLPGTAVGQITIPRCGECHADMPPRQVHRQPSERRPERRP